MSKDKSELDDVPELPDDAVLQVRDDLPELPDDVQPAGRELPELPADTGPVAASPPRALEPEPDPLELGAAPALEPIGELEPVAEPEPVARAPRKAPEVASASDSAPPSAPADRPRAAAGEKPPLRVLDKAPTHLRLAAKIVVVGAFLPFMRAAGETAGQGWAITFAAKLLVVAAAWLWMKQVLHNWGPELPGFLGKLGNLHLRPAPKEKEGDEKKKRAARSQKQGVQTLRHPFPTGLHLLSIVLIAGAFFVALQDPRSGKLGPIAPAEMGMLGWAAFTFVHIANYERWGHFNPLFPLMFLGMLFAGVAGVFAGFGVDDGLMKIASIAGGAVVAAGGGLAAYTIVEAMMQAKKEGDRKKAEALEARRAARESRRSS